MWNLLPLLIGGSAVGLTLGLFGSGGSILTVPILVYGLGHSEKLAIAESMAIVGLIALFGGISYQRLGLVAWKNVFYFGLPGMLGTYVGALLSAYMSGQSQLILFSIVMVLASYAMFRKARSPERVEEDNPKPQNRLRMALDGTLVGALSGIVGVGGGFLIVPALTTFGGLAIRTAIGTSLYIIALNCVSGFSKHFFLISELGLSIDPWTIILFVLCGSAGSQLGKRYGSTFHHQDLLRGFAVFLIIVGVAMFVKEARVFG